MLSLIISCNMQGKNFVINFDFPVSMVFYLDRLDDFFFFFFSFSVDKDLKRESLAIGFLPMFFITWFLISSRVKGRNSDSSGKKS